MELRDFYLITPLNFETSVANAVQEAWPFMQATDGASVLFPPEMTVEDGGLSFKAPMSVGLQLNYWARGAVRLLLRVTNFQARSLRELRDQLEKLDLSAFGEKKKIKVSVTVKKSKMAHSGAVKESLDRFFKRGGFEVVNDDDHDLHLFLRVFRDDCQVSVDTTGSPLFYRGYKTMTTAAPLRENLAYLLIREMVQSHKGESWEYPELVDPMAGSGSFLFEAASYFHPLHYARDFSFQSWPSCPEELKNDKTLFKAYRSHFASLSAYDHDEKALAAFSANREEFLRSYPVENIRPIERQDHFGDFAVSGEKKARWAISNPPYNHRIGIDRSEQDFYCGILQKIKEHYAPELCGLLIPTRIKAQNLELPEGWELIRRKAFKNGGLAVQFLIWQSISKK